MLWVSVSVWVPVKNPSEVVLILRLTRYGLLTNAWSGCSWIIWIAIPNAITITKAIPPKIPAFFGSLLICSWSLSMFTLFLRSANLSLLTLAFLLLFLLIAGVTGVIFSFLGWDCADAEDTAGFFFSTCCGLGVAVVAGFSSCDSATWKPHFSQNRSPGWSLLPQFGQNFIILFSSFYLIG